MHVAELKRMGAHVQLEGRHRDHPGRGSLLGAPVMASDLRASAALVLAGLKADGVTEVSRVYHIDRGYEHLDEKLERARRPHRAGKSSIVQSFSLLWWRPRGSRCDTQTKG